MTHTRPAIFLSGPRDPPFIKSDFVWARTRPAAGLMGRDPRLKNQIPSAIKGEETQRSINIILLGFVILHVIRL